MPATTAPLQKILGSPIPAFVINEIRKALPAMVFFAVGFNLIVLTTQLILDDYGARLAGFMVATMTALVVGKAVLLAKLLPFFGRFDNAPLIQPIMFKTVLYWAVVFVARFLEKLVEYLLHGGNCRHCGLRSRAFHLAPVWRDPDLDIRSVPDLCHG